jgi:DNA polymerase III subunit epsilon
MNWPVGVSHDTAVESERGPTFVALDFETANPNLASICQVGAVRFQDGVEVERWDQLVDPNDYFDPMNVFIHGITQADVEGAPTFKELIPQIEVWLTDQIVVSHTHFDKAALHQAYDCCAVPAYPQCTWLDSARVVRRAWPEKYALRGYGLSAVARDMGLTYRAHSAVDDAWAAGQVLLRAIATTGVPLDAWLDRAKRPITQHLRCTEAGHEANIEGHLYGEVLCFTGALQVPRREAVAQAAAAGCIVADNVTKHTTLLIVGDHDVRKLAGHEISSKHRKAEALIAKGQHIRILAERDFQSIVNTTTP